MADQTRRSFILALVGAGVAAGLPLPTGLAEQLDAIDTADFRFLQVQYVVRAYYDPETKTVACVRVEKVRRR